VGAGRAVPMAARAHPPASLGPYYPSNGQATGGQGIKLFSHPHSLEAGNQRRPSLTNLGSDIKRRRCSTFIKSIDGHRHKTRQDAAEFMAAWTGGQLFHTSTSCLQGMSVRLPAEIVWI